ncbi:MAG UNVERIFIED_CONTAM: hypothetical protein LVR18_36355 [Planctomycetaceae bacterium]|jgi:hypothetical protein
MMLQLGMQYWTETIPGNAQRWYFVLPNVFGKRLDGTTYEGVAVELTHGVSVSWDGRWIKHCSFFSEKNKSPGNVCAGTFCGTKSHLVQQGLAGEGKILSESAGVDVHDSALDLSPACPPVASIPLGNFLFPISDFDESDTPPSQSRSTRQRKTQDTKLSTQS